MVKIEDAVDGVLNAMRSRGCVEQSLFLQMIDFQSDFL